jgi:hypothetical protein
MSDTEWFAEWWQELDEDERREYRRLQSMLDEANAADERAAGDQTSSTPRRDVAGWDGQGELSAAERSGYGSGRQKRDSLAKIIKQHGLLPLAAMIVKDNDPHSVGEDELMAHAASYAASKGETLGKLLSAESGEGAVLAKAAAICRQGAYARQAQHNVVQMRVRAAQS